MKITLDISKLIEEDKLTPAEAGQLTALASHDVGSLSINILIGFGVVAISTGAVALVPTPATAMALGVALFALGGFIAFNKVKPWFVLGEICLVVGALMFCGGVIAYGKNSLAAMLVVTVALALASITARSSLLTVFAVLAASACLGARTGYSHAMYSLAIFEPTLTVVLFTGLALTSYAASKRLDAAYERIALAAARTAVVLVNFRFWVGSLWGDPLMLLGHLGGATQESVRNTVIPAAVFSIGWALAVLTTLIWGVQANRRWMVNVGAGFGAIHFYTQWFERLGATPLSLLLGGLVPLAGALVLRRFNRAAITA